jgi:hypothetical protein
LIQDKSWPARRATPARPGTQTADQQLSTELAAADRAPDVRSAARRGLRHAQKCAAKPLQRIAKARGKPNLPRQVTEDSVAPDRGHDDLRTTGHFKVRTDVRVHIALPAPADAAGAGAGSGFGGAGAAGGRGRKRKRSSEGDEDSDGDEKMEWADLGEKTGAGADGADDGFGSESESNHLQSMLARADATERKSGVADE